MIPLAPSTKHTVDYVSLFDPAVGRDSMSEQEHKQYAETMDRSLLKLRPGATPTVWRIRPLDPCDMAAVRSMAGLQGVEALSDVFWYAVLAIGLTGAESLPEGVPPLSVRSNGLVATADPEWIRKVPYEIACDVAVRILQLSQSDKETEKNWSWPSGQGSSKKPA